MAQAIANSFSPADLQSRVRRTAAVPQADPTQNQSRLARRYLLVMIVAVAAGTAAAMGIGGRTPEQLWLLAGILPGWFLLSQYRWWARSALVVLPCYLALQESSVLLCLLPCGGALLGWIFCRLHSFQCLRYGQWGIAPEAARPGPAANAGHSFVNRRPVAMRPVGHG